jgi:hypothetical protein
MFMHDKKIYRPSKIRVVFLAGLIGVCLSGCFKAPGKQTSSRAGEDLPVPVSGETAHPTPVLVPVEGFAVYENTDYAIRVQYPGEWEKIEGESGVAFIIPKEEEDDAVFEGFNLLFEEMHGAKMSLDQYMKLTREGMKKYMPGFTLIDSSESTLGGHPAVRMTFTAIHESSTMKFLSMFAVRNGKVYSLSFNTSPGNFDSLAGILEKIIASFQFLS